MIETPISEKGADLHIPHMRILAVDADDLKDVEDNPEAVEFSIELNQTPPEGWINEFDQAYLTTPYVLKPPVRVDGNRLRIVYLPRYASELQGFVRFLGLIVRRSNQEYRRSAELHTSSVQDQRRADFREALKRVVVPE
jgi:hypothetical protein